MCIHISMCLVPNNNILGFFKEPDINFIKNIKSSIICIMWSYFTFYSFIVHKDYFIGWIHMQIYLGWVDILTYHLGQCGLIRLTGLTTIIRLVVSRAGIWTQHSGLNPLTQLFHCNDSYTNMTAVCNKLRNSQWKWFVCFNDLTFDSLDFATGIKRYGMDVIFLPFY